MDYSATARGPARTTDDSGPNVELMVGVYTDNQPDFTYLLPYEAKALFEGMLAFAEKGLATPFKIDIRPPFGTLNANSATMQPLSNSDTDATNRHSTISQTIQQPLSNPAPTIGNLNPSTTVLQPPDGRFRAWQKPTTQPSFVSNPRTISTQPYHIRDSTTPTTKQRGGFAAH